MAMRQQPNRAAYYPNILPNGPHLLQKIDHLATITRYHRGQEVCIQGERADYWYLVLSGAACRCVIRPDGRRQIVDLLLSGDFFGFTIGEEYDFSIEAVAKGTILAAYPRRLVEAAADSDQDLSREIRRIAFEANSRLQAQLLILGRITAPEKLGSFILEMATRLSSGRSDSVALPITRCDIAEYLAVSVETVSRALTDLKQRGVITMSGTRVVKIIDRDGLEECERSTNSSPAFNCRRRDRDVRQGSNASPALQYGRPRRTGVHPIASSSVRDEPLRCAR